MKLIAQEEQCIEFNPIPTGSLWEKNRKRKKVSKKRRIDPFWGCVPDARGYLGHKFKMPGYPIVCFTYLPTSVNFLLGTVLLTRTDLRIWTRTGVVWSDLPNKLETWEGGFFWHGRSAGKVTENRSSVQRTWSEAWYQLFSRQFYAVFNLWRTVRPYTGQSSIMINREQSTPKNDLKRVRTMRTPTEMLWIQVRRNPSPEKKVYCGEIKLIGESWCSNLN